VKEIYKISGEAWRNYRGYFSSVEKAIEIIPDCPSFKRFLNYLRPEIDGEPDWSHNETIHPVLTREDSRTIKITLPGYKWIKKTYLEIPEFKKEGEPYQPMKRELVSSENFQQDFVVGQLWIDEIPLDITKDD
jgi:hypothetical protein